MINHLLWPRRPGVLRGRRQRDVASVIFLLCAMALQLSCNAQRYVKYVDSVQELKNLNVADIHASVFVRGYFAANDGGEGFFYWNSSDTTATNRGTVLKGKTTGAELATGRWNRVFKQGEVNVRWFGAKGEGSDDTTPIQAAHDDGLTANLNGTLYFPPGKWKFNLTVTKPNVTIRGSGHYMDAYGDTVNMTNRFEPAITTNAVIKVGNDSGIVRGVVIRDCNFYGATTGAKGVECAGGAFETRIQNATITQFTNCVKILGGTSYPASLIWFDHVDVQPANVDNARGFLITQTTNYPTSWTTAIYIVNSHGQGPSSASNSYFLESDSVGVYFSNSYFDVRDGHSFKISKTQSPVPHFYCSNLSIDSFPATGAAVESYSNNRYFADQISGQFTIAGKWKLLDGTLLTPPQGALRQNASLLYPQVHGSLNLVELGATTFDGGNYTNHQFVISSDNFFTRSTGIIKQQSALGAYQIEGDWSTGLSQFRLYDPVANKTVTVKGLNGSLLFTPFSGGATKLTDTNGSTIFQVNGTPGSTPFFNTLTSSKIPFIDNGGGGVGGFIQPTPNDASSSGIKLNGLVTNNAAVERSVQTLSLSGTNYTASWTNNPMQFRINLSADSGLVEANTTGTNRYMTVFVYGDNTHYLALPSSWVLRPGSSTNQPFPNGLTILWTERLDGTNYLETSIASASGTSVFVNGASVANPNFADSGTALVQAVSTNVSVYPTNLANAQISGSAAIARSKLANGTANYVLINGGGGAMSEEQYLAGSRGGLGGDNSSAITVSGTNATVAGNFFAYELNTKGAGVGTLVMTNGSFTYTVQPHASLAANVTLLSPASGFAGLVKYANSSGTMTPSQATAGTDYYAPGSTDVAIADGGTGQSTANAGLDALNQVAETTVASATTTDLGAVTSQKVSITGTTTITGFGTVAAGTVREGRFTGALTLTHNGTSLILPGGRNITTAAGDSFRAVSLGSGNWSVYQYTRVNGYSPSVITSTQTYDIGNLTTGSSEIATWTVAGVAAGDTVIVSHTQIVSAPTTTAHWTWWAVATTTDTVVTKIQNNTGGTVNPASGNIKIVVFK